MRWPLLSFITVLITSFALCGCGQDKQSQSAMILDESDIEMLASLEPQSGNAQGGVEVISAPNLAAIPQVISPVTAPAAEAIVEKVPEIEVVHTVTVTPENPTYEQKIQLALKAAGHYKGEVDGKVGRQTREALKAFQRENSLKADGLAGTKTWDLLRPYYLSAADPAE